MPVGLYVKLNSGKEYDTNSLGVGFVESFIVNPGISGSKTYPEFAGCNLIGIATTVNSAHRWYPNGVTAFDYAWIGTLNVTTVYDNNGVPTVRWNRISPFQGSHSNQAQVTIFVI